MTWLLYADFVEPRDKTFFLAHIIISALLGLFCGGLYFQTSDSIAGFQSRVGSLFFLVRSRTLRSRLTFS